MAAIVTEPGTAIDPDRADAILRTAAALFRDAALHRFVADLPRTENGKVRKYELRERGVTASTWDREASGYRLKRGAQ